MTYICKDFPLRDSLLLLMEQTIAQVTMNFVMRRQPWQIPNEYRCWTVS